MIKATKIMENEGESNHQRNVYLRVYIEGFVRWGLGTDLFSFSTFYLVTEVTDS